MIKPDRMRAIFRRFLLVMLLCIAFMILFILLFPPKHVIFREATPEEKSFPCDNPVATASGQVRGAADGEGVACAWKGIPFAVPPVGELRWRDPQPAPAWNGIREAREFGPACPQGRFMKWVHSMPVGMSEDCLTLNVWRPRAEGKFPVMVWFHGGMYVFGGGATPLYYGDRLAAGGKVVVVTVNYRLGALGFLYHDGLAREDPNGSSGNYGTLDQIAALKWVRENVSNFGGDPERVTIFGESAGGWSVCALLASTPARGLFQRAIIESGGCQSLRSREQGSETGRWAAARLGCAENNLACLRKIGAMEIVNKLNPGLRRAMEGEGSRFLPHEDGYVVDRGILARLQSGDFNNVPLLAGSNRDEVPPAAVLRPRMIFSPRAAYEGEVRKAFPEAADKIFKVYPLEKYTRAARALAALLSDRELICPTYEGMRAAAGHQVPAYYYRFDYDGMTFGRLEGAGHLSEIPFVLRNFDRKPISWMYKYQRNISDALELSRMVQGYWVNFAYRGDPNGEGLPPWPAYRPDEPRVQVLDTAVRTEVPDLSGRCAFWEGYNRDHPNILERGR
ncbi:MAG: carboxylesterase family protein [Proteobacteria bacterium]|nr:carboxylesterase family protein [Pseudomonadota bacterium]